MSEEKGLTTTNSAVPDFAKGFGADTELLDIREDELRPSRLLLGQGMHRAVQEGHAKMGDFFYSITMENFGTEIEVIIVRKESVWLKFPDDENKLEFMLKSADGKKWDNGEPLSKDDKWKCAILNYLMVVRGHLKPLPLIYGFRSMAHKEGVNLMNQINSKAQENNVPINLMVFKMKSEIRKNKKGSSALPIVTFKEYCSEDEFNFTKAIKEQFAKYKFTYEDQSEQAGEEAASSDDLGMD